MPNRLARFLHRLENAVIPRICGDGTLLAWGAEQLWAKRRQTHPHSPALFRELMGRFPVKLPLVISQNRYPRKRHVVRVSAFKP